MPATAVRNIVFRRGDTYEHTVEIPGVDMSTWTIAAQIRRAPDDRTILATFAVDMTDAATPTSTVGLSLQEVDTEQLPEESVWDVQAIIAGDTTTLFGGKVTVERDVTR